MVSFDRAAVNRVPRACSALNIMSVAVSADIDLRDFIVDVPDFPEPGVVFKDITPMLADPDAFRACTKGLAALVARHAPDALVAIESRGFIFGAALAEAMNLPLQLVRKQGKLPRKTVGVSYELEYGSDTVEMHHDVVHPGGRYAVVDDVIATGGTAEATARLLESQGGTVVCLAFVLELGFLNGRDRLRQRTVEALLRY